MKHQWTSIVVLATLGLYAIVAQAQDDVWFESCMTGALSSASSDTTIGELRQDCEQQLGISQLKKSTQVLETSDAAASTRLRKEIASEEEAFVITPYLPNYVLFGAYNSADLNNALYQEANDNPDFELDDVEVKFQLSLKVPLAKGLIGNTGDLYAAFTNRSFWQAYNTSNSSPFRESNYQPEAWMRFYSGVSFWGMRNVLNDFGIVHQSNGRGGTLSRSWNRVYARFVFERNNFAFALQPWYRIKEDQDKDNNPDIEDYMGNFEFTGAYKKNRQEFSLLLRNNLKSDNNRGAAQLDWSFPIHDRMKGYVQWFNGYGESLIDYDRRVNSIGIGVKLTDFL